MKFKNKIYTLGALAGFAAPIVGVVSCGSSTSHDHKITKAEIMAKENEWAKTLVHELEGKGHLTPELIKEVFGKHGISSDLDHGTSYKSHSFGNHYGAIDRMIARFEALSKEEKEKLTLEEFAKLFMQATQADEDKYHTHNIAEKLLIDGFVSENPKYTLEEKKGETAHTQGTHTHSGNSGSHTKTAVIDATAAAVKPLATVKSYSYSHVDSLKYADSFWTPSADYTYTDAVVQGNGQTFYSDLTEKSGKYPQFAIQDWINVYDTDTKDMFSDTKHVYADTAPTSYRASNSQFGSIYNSKPTDASAQTKSGNNNNGLNGLYSGAGFGWDGGKKTFDISKVETIDNATFSTGGTAVSNGWEHVSPQSKEILALGETPEQKRAIGDLHNLRPSIQDLFNGPRSNHPYGMVPGDTTKGGVDFEIGQATFTGLTVVEPRVNVRGDIARIIFYMHDRYHVKYDLGYYKMMALWAAMDPVTPQEVELDKKIAAVMGFHNDYVTGTKQIPYDQQIEAQVLNANKDTSKNTHTWAIGTAKTFANEINSDAKAAALDWTTATAIQYGSPKPSADPILKDAVSSKQLIIKVSIKADSTVHYFKVTTLQGKAIIASSLDGSNTIKININHSSPAYLATLLTGTSRTSYGDMTDEISELKYLVVE